MTGDITPTPWGDLEIYEYNGKYTEHRQLIDSSIAGKEVDAEQLKSTPFNPWQFDASEELNVSHGAQVLPVSIEPTSS